jgi:hypothetical protein
MFLGRNLDRNAAPAEASPNGLKPSLWEGASRPFGTNDLLAAAFPNAEALGFYRPSLREQPHQPNVPSQWLIELINVLRSFFDEQMCSWGGYKAW